jgi:hypothetical protein
MRTAENYEKLTGEVCHEKGAESERVVIVTYDDFA